MDNEDSALVKKAFFRNLSPKALKCLCAVYKIPEKKPMSIFGSPLNNPHTY